MHFSFVDPSNDLVIQVEISPIGDAIDRFADNFINRRNTFFVEIIIQTVDHILDDPIAVMHHSRANLHVARTEKHKFDRVAPSGYAADSADRNFEFRIRGQVPKPYSMRSV